MSKKRFSIKEMGDGELSVRDMSKNAQKVYSGTDLISVARYIDHEATQAAEDKAWEEERDFFPGELDVIRYAIIDEGTVTDDLTFEEAEQYLESLYEAYYEDSEN